MKRVISLLFALSVLMVLAGTTAVQAVAILPSDVLIKNFTDWTSDPYGTGTPVTLTPNKTAVTITADGETGFTWGGIYDDNTTRDAIGMKATINISEVSATTGIVAMGFSNSLGKIGTQRIQANIAYEANNSNQYRIIWRVRAKDSAATNPTWTTLAAGTLSELWLTGYNTKKNMTVYFKRSGNSIIFGITGTPYTVTWKSTKPMTPINYYPELFGSANNGTNSIKGVIKNVYLLY